MPHESTRRIVRSSNKQSIDNHKENAENELKSSSSSVKQQQQITNDDSQKLQLKTQKETSIELKSMNAQKEEFNDEIELDEMTLDQGTEWKTSIIDSFVNLLDDIKVNHQLNDVKNKNDIRDMFKKGLLLCATIKKLNRVSHLRVNKVRNKTLEEKSKLDEHHLELQNLLYEISHIKKEINKCLEFRSLDEDINLVSIDEFYHNAPANVSNPEVTNSNEHKLKLARLDWELIERQSMLDKIKQLETSIDSYQNEVKLKREQLDSLQPKLNQILEASKPTLQYLNMNFDDEINVVNENVQYLPKTLYTFYMMMIAYRDTIDKNVKIEVIGDLDEAKKFHKEDKLELDEDDSDSGGEEEAEGEEYKKKSKSKKSKRSIENPINRVFKSFPLSVKITIIVKNIGQIILNFSYLNNLKIVTVKSDVKFEKEIQLIDNSLLQADNLFICLYNNDYGTESPNVSNKFILNSLGVESFDKHIKNTGRPYKWAQLLCGLNYSNIEKEFKEIDKTTLDISKNGDLTLDMDVHTKDNEEKNDEDEDDIFILSDKVKNEAIMFQKIINKLKSRFKARYILQDIINSLKKGIIPDSEVNEQISQINSKLNKFKESTWEEFTSCKYTQHLIESNLANENECFFYELNLTNGDSNLQAKIVINQNYPRITPIFAIEIDWKHKRNFANDEAIRDMERELNICQDNFITSRNKIKHKNFYLFAKQIVHLTICFDIYLESESYFLKNNEYPRTKFFLNAVRGKDRRRPYSFVSTRNLYTQRLQYETVKHDSQQEMVVD